MEDRNRVQDLNLHRTKRKNKSDPEVPAELNDLEKSSR